MEKIIQYRDANIQIADRTLFENLSFDLHKGEFIFLNGNIGTGKTTFLKTIYAEHPFSASKSYVLGKNIIKIKKKNIPLLRRKIGFIFQDYKFLNDRNIKQNFEFVLKATGWKKDKEIDERINEVIDEVNMSDKLESMPYELSGGEKQRLATARALLNYPELILADEPTGNLDEQSSNYIVKKLYELSKNGTAVIFVTHEKRLFKIIPEAKVVSIADKTFNTGKAIL